MTTGARYEIYKAGARPYWLDGLDVLGHLGLKVAMIPHYDNAEGGTHDTRYCYAPHPRTNPMNQPRQPCETWSSLAKSTSSPLPAIPLARGEGPANPSPRSPRIEQVAVHAVRHLAFRRHTDPTVAQVINSLPDLPGILATWSPLPAGQLPEFAYATH